MAGPSAEFAAEIDRVKAATVLSSVIGHDLELKKQGREFVACCPFHSERTPSFTVNDAKSFYHCFGCGAHGDVFDWLAQKHSMSLHQAVEHLGGASPPANGNGNGHVDEIEWQPIVPPPPSAPRANVSGWDKVWPYCAVDGSILFYVRRRNAHGTARKKFLPLTFGLLGGVAGWHARHPDAPRPLYGLDRLAARPDAPVLVCEGEKAADAAQQMFPSHVCISWPAGTANVGASDWSPLAGRSVTIWPDNDTAGLKAAAQIATTVPGSIIIRVADLPARADAADAVLNEPEEWLSARIREARKPARAREIVPPPVEDPRLPVIRVHAGLRHVAVNQGMEAMAQAAIPFYQRDRQMVRAALSKAKTSAGEIVEVPSLVPVSLPVLSRALGQSAQWERVNKDGEPLRIDPPKEVVEQVAALSGHWPFPPVAGVIGTPTMRPDGSLLTEAGYDAATGLVLVAPPEMPEIPARPTRAHAEAALLRLDGLLTEFPFASDESRAAALSMLLTPVLRGALGAAVPMHVVAAPQAGTGKSYLQDVSSVLATGERCAVITVAPDPNETEKRLIGAAIASFPIIALDNCNGSLSGDFLAQVTERPLLQVRPLGSSGVVRIANCFTVFANGNNISVAADLVRRTILCTLDANMEAPETREFDHDPIKELLRNRGAFLADCLTIARAYHCADYPDRLPRIPSFERWSDLVRSSLAWLGKSDCSANSSLVQQDDPARVVRIAIFDGWEKAIGTKQKVSAAEIITVAETFDGTTGFAYPEFRNALLEVAQARGADKIDAKRLGWWLRAAARTIVGKRKLVADHSVAAHIQWGLVELA